MSQAKKRPRGRPSLKNPANQRLPMVRITQDQLDSYKSSSTNTNKSLSSWVRDNLDKAAKRDLK